MAVREIDDGTAAGVGTGRLTHVENEHLFEVNGEGHKEFAQPHGSVISFVRVDN